MPDDLATILLGYNLLVALDGGTSDELQVGARITTDVAAATKVLDKLESARRRPAGAELAGPPRPSAATWSSRRRRRRPTGWRAIGALGDDETPSGHALPDLDDAALALWVDPAGAEAAFGFGGEPDPDIAPLDGLGLTVSSISDGTATFRLRLVAH